MTPTWHSLGSMVTGSRQQTLNPSRRRQGLGALHWWKHKGNLILKNICYDIRSWIVYLNMPEDEYSLWMGEIVKVPNRRRNAANKWSGAIYEHKPPVHGVCTKISIYAHTTPPLSFHWLYRVRWRERIGPKPHPWETIVNYKPFRKTRLLERSFFTCVGHKWWPAHSLFPKEIFEQNETLGPETLQSDVFTVALNFNE